MASITNDKNGTKRIQVVCPDGQRRAIYLGRATQKQAAKFCDNVEQLVVARRTNAIDEKLVEWLHGLDDDLHAKLAAAGLVPERVQSRAMLGAFIDQYITGLGVVKIRTKLNWAQVRRWLVECFGEQRDIRTIGPNEAEDFRLHLLAGGLGENTIRRHVGRTRQIFRAALRRGLIRGENPFAGMASTVRADKTRLEFVTREVIDHVIASTADTEWKLMIALARYGGLRCPSEVLALKWSDIDWSRSRIRVPSPKTEHHPGKESRIIPLFPELEPHLTKALAEAADGAEYVIARYRDPSANLRTQFERIIKKAGEKPWGKLWQNLRSTRETELADTHPIHVVCAWIGNSQAVAKENYLQLRDEHFDRATHNPTQHTPADRSDASQADNKNSDIAQETDDSEELCGVSGNTDYPRQESNL